MNYLYWLKIVISERFILLSVTMLGILKFVDSIGSSCKFDEQIWLICQVVEATASKALFIGAALGLIPCDGKKVLLSKRER